jgi:hypothetical protein
VRAGAYRKAGASDRALSASLISRTFHCPRAEKVVATTFAAVAFAPDGRLFVGQDVGSDPPADPRLNGLVFWIAPTQTVLPSQ